MVESSEKSGFYESARGTLDRSERIGATRFQVPSRRAISFYL